MTRSLQRMMNAWIFLLGLILLSLIAPTPGFLIPPALGGGRSHMKASTATVRYLDPPSSTDGSESSRRSYSSYKPKGWDREMYRAPDDILFEWQELLCCLKFMEEKEVNAAMLAPETKEMMVGYAEAIMARGSPVNTLESLRESMIGRWKLAFTTEERYKVLPPATRIYYNIYRDGHMENILKFKDKYWDSLVSSARYELSPQGRLLFEFTSNHVNLNNPFSKASQFKLPLPQNVGNLGTTFTDVSYMDGVMWIEKLRDADSGDIYYTIYEYQGPCEEGQQIQSSNNSGASDRNREEGVISSKTNNQAAA